MIFLVFPHTTLSSWLLHDLIAFAPAMGYHMSLVSRAGGHVGGCRMPRRARSHAPSSQSDLSNLSQLMHCYARRADTDNGS